MLLVLLPLSLSLFFFFYLTNCIRGQLENLTVPLASRLQIINYYSLLSHCKFVMYIIFFL